MSNFSLAWTIKAQFNFLTLKITVASQGYTYQEDFHKSETKLPGHPTFYCYFQYWILSEGFNEKHIGALEGLAKKIEASGQVGQLLAHLEGWFLGWILCGTRLGSTKLTKSKGAEQATESSRELVIIGSAFAEARNQGGRQRSLKV